jgi:16S rRNA C967 or C1407 C5-methylase (RsmB/RsmF family)
LASENDQQIDKFLEENQGFEPMDSIGPMGNQARHMLHPCNGDTDGLYLAVLQRRVDGDGA